MKVTVFATGLVKPWAVEPLPDGTLLVTEKPGRMRIVSATGQLGAPLAGLPAVDARGQGDLLVGRAGTLPEIWTTGHRNVQAASFDTSGVLWVAEMGTRGGDELNVIEKGKNYGWPLIAYGEEYSGQPIGPGATAREGLVAGALFVVTDEEAGEVWKVRPGP